MSRAWALLVLIALPAVCLAQDGVLCKWDFERGDDGWKSLDRQGKVSLTMEKDCVFDGVAALQFDYLQRTAAIGQGMDIPGIVGVELATPLPEMKAVSFAVSTSTSVPLVFFMREKSGATYVCPIFSNAGQWNEITVGLGDFILEEHSKDADGKLDPDQVNVLGFVDASVFGRMAKQAGLPVYIEPEGPQSIWIDDVKVLSTPLPPRKLGTAPASGEALYIDNCDGPAIPWLTIGGTNLKLTLQDKGAVAGSCLKVDYQCPVRTIFALAHPLTPGSLAGTTGLALSLKADSRCMLMIVCETTSGGRYTKSARLEGGAADWLRADLKFAEFKPEGRNQGAAAPLDPAQIKQVIIGDIGGMMQAYANTLYIDEVAAIK